MSASLQQIKRRMNSVNQTMKITNAMELVATVKLQSWRKRMFDNKTYADMMIKIISEVFSCNKDFSSLYLRKNEKATKNLYIIITSTLGLCAGYNNEIYKKAKELLKEDDEIIMIGLKGAIHFQNRVLNTEYIDASNHIDYKTINHLSQYLMKRYQDGDIKSVELLYTHYKNSITFIPNMFTILPLQVKATSYKEESKYILEPSPFELANELIPLYIKTTLFEKLLESQVSEQASRRTAMENATDNANDIKEELNLEYNKQRQGNITQEITEIVAGASNN